VLNCSQAAARRLLVTDCGIGRWSRVADRSDRFPTDIGDFIAEARGVEIKKLTLSVGYTKVKSEEKVFGSNDVGDVRMEAAIELFECYAEGGVYFFMV
jgi:hypothetical protein